MESFYLDTGVFVTPLLKNLPASTIAACERWLLRLAFGDVAGVTSCLTWDEVTHVAGSVPKPYDHARSAKAGSLLQSSGDGQGTVLENSISCRLDPRRPRPWRWHTDCQASAD